MRRGSKRVDTCIHDISIDEQCPDCFPEEYAILIQEEIEADA